MRLTRSTRKKVRRFRSALRLGGVVLLVLSAILPDHAVAVLTLGLSLLSQRAQRYLRLM
ncbi:MAG: hypothetical protein WCB99_14425 [Candidatus Cybelea sp.]